MNKITSTLAVLSLVTVSSYGQKLVEGSLDQLKGEQKIKIEYNYNDAEIKGMTFSEYVAQEKNWETGNEEIRAKFIEEFNNASKGKIKATKEDSKYTLVLNISEVGRSGDAEGTACVKDSEGNVIVKIEKVRGEGGKWGTHINLMGDGAKSMGESLGKFFKSKMK